MHEMSQTLTMSAQNQSEPNCQTGYNSNHTVVLYDAYNGIPGTLLVNVVAFVVSIDNNEIFVKHKSLT